jgi:hypothetical protein
MEQKMKFSLPLNEMTIEEKIETMESIWDELTKKAESIPSPAWHEKILIEREEGLIKGLDEVLDWDKTRGIIRDSIL